MSLDVAYSLEIDEFIDADRAYELFWSERLFNKRAFVCPGSGCTAQVTCANLDKSRQDLKQVPHFKKYGECSLECEVNREVPLNNLFIDAKKDKEKEYLDSSIVDQFLLERPSNYYDNLENKGDSRPPERKIKLYKSLAEKRFRESGDISNIFSVRTAVGRCIRYFSDGTLKQRKVNIGGRDFYYESIFQPVDGRDINELPKYDRIYYGSAFVDRMRSDNGYRIKFQNRMHDGDDELIVTVRIFDDAIEKYNVRKLMLSRLENLSKLDVPRAFVFFYGHPVERESVGGALYADTIIRNLDMIDIDSENPMPEFFA